MVKITDVARRAGVSASTVSYALSGKSPISLETPPRVEEALPQPGYRPHAGPRRRGREAAPAPGRRRHGQFRRVAVELDRHALQSGCCATHRRRVDRRRARAHPTTSPLI